MGMRGAKNVLPARNFAKNAEFSDTALWSQRSTALLPRANASKSSSSLINTAALARCGGLTPAFSRFNGFSGCKGKPLKRLGFLHPTIHRAEAAVLMRDGVRIPWNLDAVACHEWNWQALRSCDRVC